jgi:hypothetical protein
VFNSLPKEDRNSIAGAEPTRRDQILRQMWQMQQNNRTQQNSPQQMLFSGGGSPSFGNQTRAAPANQMYHQSQMMQPNQLMSQQSFPNQSFMMDTYALSSALLMSTLCVAEVGWISKW